MVFESPGEGIAAAGRLALGAAGEAAATHADEATGAGGEDLVAGIATAASKDIVAAVSALDCEDAAASFVCGA